MHQTNVASEFLKDTFMTLPNPTQPRFGLFLQVDRAPEVTTTYEEVLDLIVAAEELGYHSARVTQHHFGERYGQLPSPLPFLVAAAERTKTIRLGTVVVTIPLEQPVRLAEDAAVTDLLSDGRLELGLGSGFAPDVFAAFGIDLENRRDLTTNAIVELQKVLRGEALDEQGTHLYPPAQTLLERLWLAITTEEGAKHAAQLDLGLLLGRVERGGGPPTENQSRTAQAYRHAVAALGKADEARIGVGRAIYPADDRKTAQRDLSTAIAPIAAEHIRRGLMPADSTLEDVLYRQHITHGHPEEIVKSLAEEYAAISWTELLVQIDPGDLPHDKALRALERFALEVAPYIAIPTPQLA